MSTWELKQGIEISALFSFVVLSLIWLFYKVIIYTVTGKFSAKFSLEKLNLTNIFFFSLILGMFDCMMHNVETYTRLVFNMIHHLDFVDNFAEYSGAVIGYTLVILGVGIIAGVITFYAKKSFERIQKVPVRELNVNWVVLAVMVMFTLFQLSGRVVGR